MKKTSSKAILAFTISSTILLSSLSVACAKTPTPISKAPIVATTDPVPVSKDPAIDSKVFIGYLMDSKCATKGFDDETGKINVKKNPQKHLASCLNMQEWIDSGLWISIKTGSEFKFYKFDKKGNKMADDNIMMMTSRKFNFKIAATGVMKGNVITLASVKDAK